MDMRKYYKLILQLVKENNKYIEDCKIMSTSPFTPKVSRKDTIKTPPVNLIFKDVREDHIGYVCSSGGVDSMFIKKVCYDKENMLLKINFQHKENRNNYTEYTYKNGTTKRKYIRPINTQETEYVYREVDLFTAQRFVNSVFPRHYVKPSKARSLGSTFVDIIRGPYNNRYEKIK